VEYRFRLAILISALADSLKATGQCGEANASYERSLSTLRSLEGKFPDNKAKAEIERKMHVPCHS